MYATDSKGVPLTAPKGWQILPEFTELPVGYREYVSIGENLLVCNPIDCTGTKRRKYARAYGSTMAILVPEDLDLSTLECYKEKVEKLKVIC